MKFRRPSHATVVAYLALFAAIGGSAYAASKVGTNDLKSEAVTSAKIRDATIRSADLKNFALRGESVNFAANTPNASVAAECKRGEKAVGGGGGWNSAPLGATPTIAVSRPAGRTGWFVLGSTGPVANKLSANVLCVKK